jgi:hypothetical protein
MTLEHIDLKTFVYMGKQEDLYLVTVIPGDPFDKFLFADFSERQFYYILEDDIYPSLPLYSNLDDFDPVGRVLNDRELVKLSCDIAAEAMSRLNKERFDTLVTKGNSI